MGAAPTGKKIKVQAVMVQRVENGKIVEHWAIARPIPEAAPVITAVRPVSSNML